MTRQRPAPSRFPRPPDTQALPSPAAITSDAHWCPLNPTWVKSPCHHNPANSKSTGCHRRVRISVLASSPRGRGGGVLPSARAVLCLWRTSACGRMGAGAPSPGHGVISPYSGICLLTPSIESPHPIQHHRTRGRPLAKHGALPRVSHRPRAGVQIGLPCSTPVAFVSLACAITCLGPCVEFGGDATSSGPPLLPRAPPRMAASSVQVLKCSTPRIERSGQAESPQTNEAAVLPPSRGRQAVVPEIQQTSSPVPVMSRVSSHCSDYPPPGRPSSCEAHSSIMPLTRGARQACRLHLLPSTPPKSTVLPRACKVPPPTRAPLAPRSEHPPDAVVSVSRFMAPRWLVVERHGDRVEQKAALCGPLCSL